MLKKKKLTTDQTNIDSYVTTQEAFVNYLLPGDEALQQFLDTKFLTIAQFKEFMKQDATASAVSKAVQADLETTIKVTDGDIKKYYDENKASYDTSTVSAKTYFSDRTSPGGSGLRRSQECQNS